MKLSHYISIILIVIGLANPIFSLAERLNLCSHLFTTDLLPSMLNINIGMVMRTLFDVEASTHVGK